MTRDLVVVAALGNRGEYLDSWVNCPMTTNKTNRLPLIMAVIVLMALGLWLYLSPLMAGYSVHGLVEQIVECEEDLFEETQSLYGLRYVDLLGDQDTVDAFRMLTEKGDDEALGSLLKTHLVPHRSNAVVGGAIDHIEFHGVEYGWKEYPLSTSQQRVRRGVEFQKWFREKSFYQREENRKSRLDVDKHGLGFWQRTFTRFHFLQVPPQGRRYDKLADMLAPALFGPHSELPVYEPFWYNDHTEYLIYYIIGEQGVLIAIVYHEL